ncbi:MAG: ribosome silencing factor [Gammaproteobacteria bacterium]|nr:ribosome silencing factor [Gammaproteobacteria bacterium]MBU1506360.1 ribosome silencing factor [Gammaproteobacteria bacterium]MBU2123361.1 ribosome silencing factor [Gammaproteobacteria bacterium]MBU2169690.1 ribosome silencing factor [Gammaproteobacteria bacterium]MBU2201395.1 ribosome silencing factor [Gammaproteobacteria bacterium]
MTTSTKSETAAKKDVTKLQRAIVDGLEDVKAQDIQVFNTEHLSPLFERVIVASGTSNRQTKALAASVRDAVKEAGFTKPRIEGEDNGEWIIVDCGAAVAHIMQPAIRQYYRLEELWGDTPVRLKLGAAKPVSSAATALAEKKSAQKAAKSDAKSAGKAPAKKAAAPAVAARSGKATVKAVSKTAAKPAAAPAKAATKTTAKAPAKTIAKAPAKSSSTAKATAKPTTAAKKPAATKAPIKTVVVKPSASRSKAAAAAKTGAKPTSARGGAAAKPAAKRAPGRK